MLACEATPTPGPAGPETPAPTAPAPAPEAAPVVVHPLLPWLDPDSGSALYSRIDPKVDLEALGRLFAVPPRAGHMLRDVMALRAGLAALMYAIDDAHGVTIGYIHERSRIIAVALVALLLWPGRAALASAMKESKEKYAVTAWLEDLLRHPVTFKSKSGAELAASRADDLVRGYLDARKKHFKSVFRQVMAALGIQVVASAAVLGVGGWLVVEGKLSVGQLVAAELVVTSVVAGIVARWLPRSTPALPGGPPVTPAAGTAQPTA